MFSFVNHIRTDRSMYDKSYVRLPKKTGSPDKFSINIDLFWCFCKSFCLITLTLLMVYIVVVFIEYKSSCKLGLGGGVISLKIGGDKSGLRVINFMKKLLTKFEIKVSEMEFP